MRKSFILLSSAALWFSVDGAFASAIPIREWAVAVQVSNQFGDSEACSLTTISPETVTVECDELKWNPAGYALTIDLRKRGTDLSVAYEKPGRSMKIQVVSVGNLALPTSGQLSSVSVRIPDKGIYTISLFKL